MYVTALHTIFFLHFWFSIKHFSEFFCFLICISRRAPILAYWQCDKSTLKCSFFFHSVYLSIKTTHSVIQIIMHFLSGRFSMARERMCSKANETLEYHESDIMCVHVKALIQYTETSISISINSSSSSEYVWHFSIFRHSEEFIVSVYHLSSFFFCMFFRIRTLFCGNMQHSQSPTDI